MYSGCQRGFIDTPKKDIGLNHPHYCMDTSTLLPYLGIYNGKIANNKMREHRIVIPVFIIEEAETLVENYGLPSLMKWFMGSKNGNTNSNIRIVDLNFNIETTDMFKRIKNQHISEIDKMLIALADHEKGIIVTKDKRLAHVAYNEGLDVCNSYKRRLYGENITRGTWEGLALALHV